MTRKPSEVRPKNRSRFAKRVCAVVRDIPSGQVLSYGEVARQAGVPGSARAVGTLMRKNLDADVPCHRVIRADLRVGEYNRGGTDRKAELLREEGVTIRGGRGGFSVIR